MAEDVSKGLYCGAAKRCISPSDEYLGLLYGIMGRKLVAVNDDIYVRVIALKQDENIWLICAFDLDKAPNPDTSMAAITEKYGIPEENITFCAIHTHTAPVLGKRPGEAHNDVRSHGEEAAAATDRFEEFVHEKLMEAVDDAVADMKPARVRFGYAPCNCNVNRCADYYDVDENGDATYGMREGPNVFGPVDHNMYVVAFESEDGEAIAYMINYAVHNTVMFQNRVNAEGDSAVSADVGGNVSKMLEKKFPGTVALWCSGAAGNVMPMMPMISLLWEATETDYEYEFRQKKAATDQLCSNQYASALAAINGLSDPMPDPKLDTGVVWTSTPGRTVIRDNGNITIVSGPDQPPYRIRVHVVKLGDLLIVGIAGELYSTYAFELKEKFPQYNVIVINHDASLLGDAGYIMDDETWDNVAALKPGARTIPGAPPRFEKGYVSEALIKAVSDMVEKFED